MKKAYISKRFGATQLTFLELIDDICDDYVAQGFTLSLRQLYYQLVGKNVIENNLLSYKRLIRTVSEGRLAGKIDWDAIEDRTRNLNTHGAWDSPADIIRSSANCFQIDPWEDQDYYVETWVEKDALISVIEHACEDYRVPSFSCRGYTSQTEVYEAAKRFRRKNQQGKEGIIIHLGDHDPSGIDMTRDIEDRMATFQASVLVNRIALSHKQVRTYKLPPNPVKMKDVRTPDYEAKYGIESWELDALEPSVIVALVKKTILEYVDLENWEHSIDVEDSGKEELELISNNYDDTIRYLQNKDEDE